MLFKCDLVSYFHEQMQVADDLTRRSNLSMGWMLERMCDLKSATPSVRNWIFVPSLASFRLPIKHHKHWKSAQSSEDISKYWCRDELSVWYLLFFWFCYVSSRFGPAPEIFLQHQHQRPSHWPKELYMELGCPKVLDHFYLWVRLCQCFFDVQSHLPMTQWALAPLQWVDLVAYISCPAPPLLNLQISSIDSSKPGL